MDELKEILKRVRMALGEEDYNFRQNPIQQDLRIVRVAVLAGFDMLFAAKPQKTWRSCPTVLVLP